MTVEVTSKSPNSPYNEGVSFVEITIPDSVIYEGNTYYVTDIGKYAFSDCATLKTITIPNSIINIGKYAFRNCTTLTTIKIGNNVKTIADGAFQNCTILSSIRPILSVSYPTIPNSVITIGSEAFRGCLGLTSITIGNGVQEIGSSVFSGCSSLKSATIGTSVKEIGNSAFYNCSALTSITIPNSVTSIGEKAFEGCSSLASVSIGNDVTSIGRYAFRSCSSLTSITIPNNVTTVGASVFRGCSSLKSATIGTSVKEIGNSAFYNCSALTSITIPNSVTKIGDSAFSGCSSLTSITIPNSVTKIGDSAFSGCSGLTSATISNSVTSIGDYTFKDCSSLTSITIPNSVTSIGGSTFYGCSSLTSITIPNNVTVIENGAFYGCSSLTSITIPNSVTKIGDSAFSGCSGLTSATISNSVTSIGDYTFKDCSSLTSISIPNNVTVIENGAFYGCSGLTSVTIGNSVTSIGEDAFYNCSALTSITIPNNVTSIRICAFYNCSSLTSVTIGNSVTNIGSSAFSKCSSLTSVIWNAENYADFSSYAAAPFYNVNKTITSFTFGDNVRHIPTYLCHYMNQLTSITIPHSVTSIGEGAFYNCSSLTKTNYTGDVTSWCKINFGSYAANPIYYSRNFYINDQEIKDLVIPNTVDKIPNSAFENCSSLTSVTIGNSVTSIGNYAFGDCSSLTSVTIGNSVTSIGYNAFDDCSSLTSVTIPNSVTSIGDNAFEYCYGLTKTNYTGNVASWCKIKFGNYEANPIYYSRNFYINDQEIKDLVVPNIVDTIHNYAFCNCRSLKSITIPNGVKSIGDDAFYGCYSLISITVDDENVVYDSRNNCNAIIETANNTLIRGCQNTLIPNGITKILNNAFSWDIHMDTIYVEATIPPILGDESDDDFEFPGSYESICIIPYGTLEAYQSSSWANYVNYFIEQVGTRDSDIKWIMNGGSVADTLPTSLTASYKLSNTPTREGYGFIGWYDNPEGRGLALTILPAGYKGTLYAIWVGATLNSCGDHCYWRYLDNILTITGTGAMYDYTPSNPTPWDNYRRSDIHTISLSEGLTSIGGWAFGECESITSITIPNSVTNIGDKAFWGCRKLDSITVPNSVTHIGERAFYSCVRLTSITLPDNLTSIEKYLLGYCSSLVSVVIPENVTTIGEMALAYCSSLSAITIPETVNYVEWGAFYGSNDIDSVIVEATTPPAIGERGLIFSSSPTCYIPCGTLAAYQSSSWAEQVGSFVEQCDEPVVDANKCGDNLYWAYTDGTLTITGTGDMYNYDYMDNLAPWNSVSNNIKNIVLPEGLTSIGEWAFYLCASVTSISIPEGVSSIGVRAFCNCSSLTSISIPNSVTSIGERAFYNCYNLASATLSTNLSKIDKYLFGQCRTLTAITIPNNVTAIENGAFSGCSSLDSISIEATNPPVLSGSSTFSSSPTCYIPCGTLAVYQSSSWAEQVGGFVEQCDDNDNNQSLISVTDATLSDWDNLPMEYLFESKCVEGASLDALKSVKVYADLTYINLVVEWDTEIVTDLTSVPFHVYLNVDNDAPTGGFGDQWVKPNIDLLLEGYFYLDGNPCAYQPDVALYAGTPLANEWAWDWTTIESLAASQLITKGVMEIQIEYGKLPVKLQNTFTVGFDIQQSWSSVGVLPNAANDNSGNRVLAEKMLVRINNVNAPTSIENTHSPSSITNTHKLLRNGQLIILHDGKTYTVMGAEIK